MTDSNLPRIPDGVDQRRLQAMKLVADMRATADRCGSSFIGGFMDPFTGETFVMTNLDEAADQAARQEVTRKLRERRDLPQPWDDPLA